MKDEILAIVRETYGEGVQPETTLESLDMDSLEFIELVQECERATGVNLPDSAITRVNDVSDVISLFEKFSA